MEDGGGGEGMEWNGMELGGGKRSEEKDKEKYLGTVQCHLHPRFPTYLILPTPAAPQLHTGNLSPENRISYLPSTRPPPSPPSKIPYLSSRFLSYT